MKQVEKKFLEKLKPISQYNERHELRKEIIKMIALGGFAAACLVAPGLMYAAKIFPGIDKKEHWRLRHQLRSLLERGIIEERNQKFYLTAKGTLYNNKIKISEFELSKDNKKKWNKRWHIVMFDIPESHKSARDSFRRKLLSLGYTELQKSVYILPFDHSQELHQLAKLHDVEIDIFTAELSRVDNLKALKRHFSV